MNVSDVPKEDLFIITSMAFGVNSMLLLEAATHGVPSYSHHIIKKNNQMWLSTLRNEILELGNFKEISELFEN
jgi:hypothetical protein